MFSLASSTYIVLLAIDSRMFRRPDPQPNLPSQLVNLLKSKVISSTSDCWMARTLACWACWTEQQVFIKPSLVTPETPRQPSSWFKPYGVPYRLLLDPDPTFRGEFQRQAESLGTVVEHCPAEAHWTIGAVERRNATLRCILEKLIDQWTVLDLEQFNRILPLATHAMNSFTFTRGRTAYQAVFGRIPRLPGGLFTDDCSLASSPSTLNQPNNMMAKAEMIRAEAQKHLIDLNVNQQNFNLGNHVPIGVGIRWQRRGPKKRGAWVLSRFLKLAWVRSGNASILVTAE